LVLFISAPIVGNPFPLEPIGAGARWEQPLYGSGPMAANGTASFELASVEGERLTTRFLIQQTSREQPVPRSTRRGRTARSG
jgi:hypothetical protein